MLCAHFTHKETKDRDLKGFPKVTQAVRAPLGLDPKDTPIITVILPPTNCGHVLMLAPYSAPNPPRPHREGSGAQTWALTYRDAPLLGGTATSSPEPRVQVVCWAHHFSSGSFTFPPVKWDQDGSLRLQELRARCEHSDASLSFSTSKPMACWSHTFPKPGLVHQSHRHNEKQLLCERKHHAVSLKAGGQARKPLPCAGPTDLSCDRGPWIESDHSCPFYFNHVMVLKFKSCF